MNRKMLSAAIIIASAAFTFTSCSTSKKAMNDNKSQSARLGDGVAVMPAEDMDPTYLIYSDAQREVIRKNNHFAFNLFHQMEGMDGKVVSPMSIAYLMGMLANGASEATQQEILKAIGCEGVSVEELNQLYQGMMQVAGKQDKQTTVKIANYIAVNKNNKINGEFAKTVGESYQAAIESLDFSSAKTTSRINGWCSEHTDGMIPKIITQVDASAISYLLNAIYFNGTWTSKFDAHNTKQENFRGFTRDIQKVDMMHQVKKFRYLDNDTFKAVNLPYGNGSYSMTVFLPNEDKSIFDMMKVLDAEKLAQVNRDMDYCMVNLKLPKFTTETSLGLNDIISKLGAPMMFNPSQADFSQFAKGNFFVSKMLQKAKIEVSEQGTKAAAVTAAIMLTSAAPMEYRHVDFIANRPFVYMITDRQSGAILFMGQYTGK